MQCPEESPKCQVLTSRSYLASLAAVDPVVEARGLVPADSAQHVVIVVEL